MISLFDPCNKCIVKATCKVSCKKEMKFQRNRADTIHYLVLAVQFTAVTIILYSCGE